MKLFFEENDDFYIFLSHISSKTIPATKCKVIFEEDKENILRSF